jgi:hypothetical protein
MTDGLSTQQKMLLTGGTVFAVLIFALSWNMGGSAEETKEQAVLQGMRTHLASKRKTYEACLSHLKALKEGRMTVDENKQTYAASVKLLQGENANLLKQNGKVVEEISACKHKLESDKVLHTGTSEDDAPSVIRRLEYEFIGYAETLASLQDTRGDQRKAKMAELRALRLEVRELEGVVSAKLVAERDAKIKQDRKDGKPVPGDWAEASEAPKKGDKKAGAKAEEAAEAAEGKKQKKQKAAKPNTEELAADQKTHDDAQPKTTAAVAKKADETTKAAEDATAAPAKQQKAAAAAPAKKVAAATEAAEDATAAPAKKVVAATEAAPATTVVFVSKPGDGSVVSAPPATTAAAAAQKAGETTKAAEDATAAPAVSFAASAAPAA